MVSESIAKGDIAALNYFIADKYIKAFGGFAESPNQKVIMLPVEAMSMLGSLAGIGEIAKATFNSITSDSSADATGTAAWARLTALKIIRARWHIENTAFNQWIQHWNDQSFKFSCHFHILTEYVLTLIVGLSTGIHNLQTPIA